MWAVGLAALSVPAGTLTAQENPPHIDNAVGTLTGALKQQGLLDDTIVLFTSDHGCHSKTRNTEYKRSPHDSSVHIPLVIADRASTARYSE